MKCEICGKAPPKDDVALFRINEVGVPGIWRCRAHLTHDQEADIDSEVHKIVRIIEEDNRSRS